MVLRNGHHTARRLLAIVLAAVTTGCGNALTPGPRLGLVESRSKADADMRAVVPLVTPKLLADCKASQQRGTTWLGLGPRLSLEEELQPSIRHTCRFNDEARQSYFSEPGDLHAAYAARYTKRDANGKDLGFSTETAAVCIFRLRNGAVTLINGQNFDKAFIGDVCHQI